MKYRVGKCGSCGAAFKVPASFQGDKAKCKSCGTGVVEIGPVQSLDQEEELVEHVPSGKKDGGPSMKERLLAGRGEPGKPGAAAPVPARKVAAGSARKPAPGKPAQSKTQSKTQPKPAATRSGGKPAPAGKARASRKPAAESPTRSSARAKAGAGRTPTRRSGARGGKSVVQVETDEHGGRWHPKKKSNPGPMIGILVVLAIGAFGAWKYFLEDKGTPTDDTVAAAGSGEGTDPTPVDDAGSDADDTTGTDESADPVGDPADDTVAAEPVEDPEDAVVEAPKPRGADLSALEPFAAPEGTSEEEWTEIVELVDTYVDPLAGAKGSRAGKKLEDEIGKAAFPAIVNKMLTLDYATEGGFRDGDILQRTLSFISNGKNAGWKYGTTEDDVAYNQKAAALLYKVWDRAKDDEEYWLSYTKQDKKGAEDEAEVGLDDTDLDDLDDLDDF